MGSQFVPFSPFQMFNPSGPLGFFPNNFAANAGDLPNILWVSSLQTPLLNSFSPVFPPLVQNIFGGGPQALGQGFRPAPLGASSLGGFNLGIPGTNNLAQFGGQAIGGNPGIGSIGVAPGNNTGTQIASNFGLSSGQGFGFGGGPGLGSVGGMGFSGNLGFLQQLGFNGFA